MDTYTTHTICVALYSLNILEGQYIKFHKLNEIVLSNYLKMRDLQQKLRHKKEWWSHVDD